MTHARLAIALALVALVIALGGAIALHQSLATKPVARTVAQTYFAGYYPTTKLIDVDDVNIGPGEYHLTYSFTVNFTGPSPSSELVCELKDPNATIIRFDPDSTKRVRSSPAPQRVSFTGNYQLPYVDVGIRCHSSEAGAIIAHFSHVELGYRQLD